MRTADRVAFACPECRSALAGLGSRAVGCAACGETFSVVQGIPQLYRRATVRGADRMMRAIYDTFGPLHDPGVRHVLPFVDGTSEAALRRRVVAWMELDRVHTCEGALRILEVGIGTGSNLAYFADAVPPDRGAIVWGVDLSRTMLAACARRASRTPLDVRLAVADAHALPFENDTFDRVLHIGGIGSFRDPRAALAEMARVAKPGASIVVADEELDARARPGFLAHVAFRALTFNQWRPRAPLEHLPRDAVEVEVAALSAFYFVLRFVRARSP